MKNRGIKKLFWFVIVFAMMLMMQVGVALGAEITSSDLLTGATGVPINQVITLTTDNPCITTPSGITLDGGMSLAVSLQNGKIVCVPSTMLVGGMTYTLTIPINTAGILNTIPYSVTFTTAYNLDQMINNLYTPVTLNTLMTTYSPRGLNVGVPKKYLTNFNISYYKDLANPLTNVDITADAEVNDIMVTFGAATPIHAIKNSAGWNTGYQGTLTTTDAKGQLIGQDIVFQAFDKYGRLLEKKKTIKLNVKGNKLDLSSTRSLAVPTKFANLILSNGKLFTSILKQYDVDELSLSVAD